jgi:hypothetical protein
MSVYSLVYTSECRLNLHHESGRSEIEKILMVATCANATQGISGALLFSEGRFVQVLEGKQPQVKQLMENIQRDKRHSRIQILTGQFTSRRRFHNWSMAFVGDSPRLRKQFASMKLHTDDALQGDALLDFMLEIIAGEEELA